MTAIFVDSMIIFLIAYLPLALSSGMSDGGHEFGLFQTGMTVYCSSCFAANIWVVSKINQVDYISVISFVLTFGAPHFFFLVYSYIPIQEYDPIYQEIWPQIEPQILLSYFMTFLIFTSKDLFRR